MLDKVAAEYAAKGVMLAKIDVDKDKVIAAQFRIQSIPTVYAIYRGQPVADLTDFRTEAQLKRALDQLLGQLKIGAEGAAPQAEIEPLVAMAEQVLADGDAPRAVSIFRQIRDMAPDNPAVIGGLVRALVAAGEIDEARADPRRPAGRAREEAGNRPGHAPRSRWPRRARGRHRRARSAARRRIPTTMKRGSSSPPRKWRPATATPPPTRCSRSSGATASGTRARPAQRFLQLLEAQGLEDPWSSAQRRRLSALLFT